MSKLITFNVNKKPAYDIMLEKDFSMLKAKLVELEYTGRKCCIVCDTNTKDLYLNKIKKAVEGVFDKVIDCTFEAGEKNKNTDTVYSIIDTLVNNNFDRHDILIALGGGVVGDTTGYAAAIYMRGIDFIQIPTTLLACVDSSIGGKTGVDYKSYKNLVGAFKMPSLVYIAIETLSTLPERQYYNGMGEVMKYGLIMDASLYEWIIEKMYDIHDKKSETLEELVSYCIDCKKRIVEKDPFEKGDRMLLNFGHTIGHAIEREKNFEFLHGECIALGMVAAAYISLKKEKISSDEFYEIRDMFVPFNLPITIDNIDPDKILETLKHDKKSNGKIVKFILLKKVGKAYIDETVTDEEILAAIREIHFTEEDMKA